jgi:hypothetical protein
VVSSTNFTRLMALARVLMIRLRFSMAKGANSADLRIKSSAHGESLGFLWSLSVIAFS